MRRILPLLLALLAFAAQAQAQVVTVPRITGIGLPQSAAVSVTSGTLTDSAPALSITQTWNSGATTFVGADMDITDTASAAGSYLQRWRVGGTTLAALDKAGVLFLGGATSDLGRGGALQVGSTTSSGSEIFVARYNAGGAQMVGASSRGATVGSHGVVNSGDSLLFVSGDGSDGTAFQRAAQIIFGVDAAPSSGIVPGRFRVLTANASGTLTESFRVDSAQALQLAAGKSFTMVAPVMTRTAPTIASGLCTSPTISASNGTAAFAITVGTSCSGVSTGTLTMPAATTGWVCHFVNVTNPASSTPSQTGGSTTTVTFTNYVRTTGVAGDFTASDSIRVKCSGY